MSPDERRILRGLRDDVSEFHVIMQKTENGISAALAQIGIAGFKLTDEIWHDVTALVVKCHAAIDKLSQKGSI